MTLIIDIPENVFKKLEHQQYYDVDAICNAIYHGTPLPEHHGRLIDADAFQRYCFNKNFDKRLSEGGLATINMFLEFQPTIIEADKGSDDE